MTPVTDAINRRYTTKAYEKGYAIPDAQFGQLLEVLRKAPSSVNSQPWHFVVASTPQARARIATAAAGAYAYNRPKIEDASHVVVFASRMDMTDAHLAALLAQEAQDGRFANEEAMAKSNAARHGYVDGHRFETHDVAHWLEKQVYLALGSFLMGAALLGIDSTPMEGFDRPVLDTALGLREKGYSACVIVALGKRSEHDFNATLPKSRLPDAQVFTFL